MPLSNEQIKAEALRLPVRERALLAEELISSLDEDDDVEAAWTEEIERRVAEVREGRVELVDAEEVMARLRARFLK
jgi:putative addiction module component (TIGR02574 family)